ncbi:MAG: DUF4249 domain-containing protein [Muribaculaceae bacterium]|nr:DUF4249 domain-containing protein [Muribaculaceae bacterium]
MKIKTIFHGCCSTGMAGVLFLWCTGCDEPSVTVPSMPVIEGYISSEGYPSVLFSSSVVPGTDGNFSESVINWGKVSVSDGKREVILTGRVDDTYMPPFRYYSFDLIGEPGNTYTVRADYKQFHAESSCTMPYPTTIDSITLAETEVDSLRAASLHFTAPDDVPAYYYLTMNDNDRHSHPQPCMLGTFKAETPSSHCIVAVWKPKSKIESVKYVPQLRIGDEVTVHLNRVPEEVYNFWNAYDNMIMFSTSPFISTDAALPTNIKNGLGIWCVQATSSLALTVK